MAEYDSPEFEEARKQIVARLEMMATALGLFQNAIDDAINDPLSAEFVLDDILDAEEIDG